MTNTAARETCSTCPHAFAKVQSAPESLTCELDPPASVTIGTVNQQGGRTERQRRWMQPVVSPLDSCSRHPARQARTEQSDQPVA